MKTSLALGLAFLDSHGIRRCSFQLLNPQRVAVASADYEMGIRRRLHTSGLKATEANAFAALTEKLADQESVKSLEWAYATSPLADEYGFRHGGWIAKLGLPGEPAHAIHGYEGQQFERALDYVRSLPFPWSGITLAVHPEYAAEKVAS